MKDVDKQARDRLLKQKNTARETENRETARLKEYREALVQRVHEEAKRRAKNLSENNQRGAVAIEVPVYTLRLGTRSYNCLMTWRACWFVTEYVSPSGYGSTIDYELYLTSDGLFTYKEGGISKRARDLPYDTLRKVAELWGIIT